jgi:hypothetical protein
VEEHAGRGDPDPCQRREDSLSQKAKEKIEEFDFRSMSVLAEKLLEEGGSQLLKFRWHFAIRSLVEDLENFEVGQFKTTPEVQRMSSKEFSEVEDLYLGDGLELIDFIEDREDAFPYIGRRD